MFKVKSRPGEWVALIALIIFAIIFICFIYEVNRPKPTATAEQVFDVLVAHGFEPHNDIEQLKAQTPDANVSQYIVAKKDDIDFRFYVCDFNETAIGIYQQLHSIFITKRRGVPYSEYDSGGGNYSVYILTAKGKCSFAIRIGNTAVYAYCNEENDGKIATVLREIGYLDS